MRKKFTPKLRHRLRRLRRRLVPQAEAPTRLRVMSWNVRVGRNRKAAGRAVKQQVKLGRYPHVVCLQESGRYLGSIRGRLTMRRRLWGYRVYVTRRWGESHQTITLVRRDVPVKRSRYPRGTHHWWGPVHGWLHPPRTFVRVDLGTLWRVINVHRTWVGPQLVRGGRNVPAWRAEHDRLVRIAENTGRRALVIAGDHNNATDSRATDSVPNLAAQIGAHLVRARGGVDYAVVRGATGKGRAGSKRGSDHRVRLFTLTHDAA